LEGGSSGGWVWPEETRPLALKEWNVTVEALVDGWTTLLLRKGGIREPHFVPRAKSFLLFPTSFHTDASVLQADAAGRYQDLLSWELGSEVPFTVLAEVTGLWTTMDPEGILDATSSFHIWGPKFVETRLKWRKTQPVTVMELRAYRLREPMVLPRREEYAGCFSWVEPVSQRLDDGLMPLRATSTPAIANGEFAGRQRRLRDVLEAVPFTELLYDGLQ